MKKLLIIAGVAMGLMVGCTQYENGECVKNCDEPKEEVKAEAPKKEEPKKEAEPKQKPEQIMAILEESFATTMDVEYLEDVKVFTLTPTDPGFMTELLMTLEGTMAPDDWNTIVENFKSASSSTPGYGYAILNSENPDLVLLEVKDGKVLYDVVRDGSEEEVF